jgi:hypothetical protein
MTTTEPIQAVEVTPKPKLPRRYLWVGNASNANGEYDTGYAHTEQRGSPFDGTIYALPASDEAEKPDEQAEQDRHTITTKIPALETAMVLMGQEITRLREIADAKPTVSAIPPVQEFCNAMEHIGTRRMFILSEPAKEGMARVHALVASRVVVQKPVTDPDPHARDCRCSECEPNLDPIRAIVELIDLYAAYSTGRSNWFDTGNKLSVLKRSLETPK